jgi:hypothetical protein
MSNNQSINELESPQESNTNNNYHYDTVDTREINSISLTANINKNIIKSGNYYGLRGGGFGKSRSAEFNASYNLPTGSMDLDIGAIYATLEYTVYIGRFKPIISIVVDKNANVTSSVRVVGNDITATAKNYLDKAQEVIWDTENRLPTVHARSEDILSSTVTSNDVETFYSSKLQAVTDSYNFNVLSNWNFQIEPVPANENSIINNYALANGRTTNNVFKNGEHVILSTSHPYSVKIEDINGVEQTIVNETQIHAIVYHDDNAPPLL